ncbi:hypothetical protein AAGT95_03075 [Salinicola lusitanus]|uniref:Uncharacterized protein n=1 Tax=Salinicola lusitanus TaxID=1949085 RepID=A0ABZ3CUZ1_9GAMM
MSGRQEGLGVTACEIMEQAQCYTSTWSSVGGLFDHGDTLTRAQDEETELRRLVERLAFERDSYREHLRDVAKALCPDGQAVIGMLEEQYPEHLRRGDA